MNLSRAYTLAYGGELSVGRVQTPTLAMLVERELAIRSFVPEDYLEVMATFRPEGKPDAAAYKGTWFRDMRTIFRNRCGCPATGPTEAWKPRRSWRGRGPGSAAIESIKAETQRMGPPPLYDLTELQRHANRLFGFSAQKTLDVAQALYEQHKLISYPRTDSRHLSQDVAATLPRIVKTIAEPYREHLAPGTGERPLGRRFVDDAKVSDHHAIIPTTTAPGGARLSPDEEKIYDLICRRLLSAWHEDHIWSVTTVITAIHRQRRAVAIRIGITPPGLLCSRWAGRFSICRWRRKSRSRPGQIRQKRSRRKAGAAAGTGAWPGAGCAGRGQRPQEDARAETIHRRHAADGDGNGGQDAR